jgi:hypothetical protein
VKRLFTAKANYFLPFQYENVHRMKNKHDAALMRTSYLSNEIVKITPIPHETIPLTKNLFIVIFHILHLTHVLDPTAAHTSVYTQLCSDAM